MIWRFSVENKSLHNTRNRMNTSLLKLARQNFDRPYIPRHIVRHNVRQWVNSLRHLGDKWLLAQKVTKN